MGGRNWQRKVERGAAAQVVLCPQPPAVRLDDGATDGKSHTQAIAQSTYMRPTKQTPVQPNNLRREESSTVTAILLPHSGVNQIGNSQRRESTRDCIEVGSIEAFGSRDLLENISEPAYRRFRFVKGSDLVAPVRKRRCQQQDLIVLLHLRRRDQGNLAVRGPLIGSEFAHEGFNTRRVEPAVSIYEIDQHFAIGKQFRHLPDSAKHLLESLYL